MYNNKKKTCFKVRFFTHIWFE